MPMYVYECDPCEHHDEFFYNMDDERPASKKCPKCGKMTMKRVFLPTPHKWSQWAKEDVKPLTRPINGKKNYY
jgi:putative FmdB family regulatory protein